MIVKLKKLFLVITITVTLILITQNTYAKKKTPKKETPSQKPTVTHQFENQTYNTYSGPTGTLDIDVTDAVGKYWGARIDLLELETGKRYRFDFPEGKGEQNVPIGQFRAYIFAYDNGVPVMVQIKDITIKENQPVFLPITLLEGTTGPLVLRDFDGDCDLVLDRVEIEAGTDPYNPLDIPGKKTIPINDKVLNDKPGWYKGELCAFSKYSIGSESVGELIKRAEKENLDFLAITDINTLKSIEDPEYKSEKIVLIPAMKWGNDKMGYALVYCPRTPLDIPSTIPEAQGECIRVQAQGGIFAIAHPCFPTGFWQWGLNYVNAIQVWCREWRAIPPLTMDKLDDWIKEKKDGKFIYSLAAAVNESNIANVSANIQAARFWDYEIARGAMICGIAGSHSSNPSVPLGRPITYVRAEKKSLSAILDGIRLGRTYVSSGPNGPKLSFVADSLADNKIDVSIGGIVPLGIDIRFEAIVTNAKGKKLEVIFNGRPIVTKIVESDNFTLRFTDKPTRSGAYRLRIIGPPEKQKGFGDVEVYAMTSPIYAQDITPEILWRLPKFDPKKAWIEIKPSEEGSYLNLPEN
ncbi:MAG TPA: CehA/McbA family metallohydrolase [Candidatus Hydrogenedens sp.]|nr:CehA/McbA family metallohydrolase [Candidatus Hydrogenedens sp.]HOK09901.1 CehA/McbA family metallohydrolase [Candidatus Hydrogenedens sp.]HOL19784.1 CehA/McbA family metallohydrolase [Candidatus Hydrogenedens sp.]HPP59523.1 CehA/McbA family metallohydrolase [Candidatus Hydrogenedens sp.]